jgi:hypothetical protein
VQWALLLAVATVAGYLQRHSGLPKVVGYTLVGTIAGLAGFGGAVWPLQGIGLFLLELGVAVVLFDAAGASRCAGSATTPWCWCKAWPSRPDLCRRVLGLLWLACPRLPPPAGHGGAGGIAGRADARGGRHRAPPAR